jgi:DNA-binding PadR family transcriptional regulator
MSSATRLVLGPIRILQPVHGYDVRRELLTLRLEELANVKPGSIYSAMRTLEKDGCIAVHSAESAGNRPERTSYRGRRRHPGTRPRDPRLRPRPYPSRT